MNKWKVILKYDSGRFFEPSEDSLHSAHAHAVDHIARQTERNSLWRWKQAALLKRNAQVDVDQLCALQVDQDVLHVPIAQTHDVSDNAVGGDTARVRQSTLVPLC